MRRISPLVLRLAAAFLRLRTLRHVGVGVTLIAGLLTATFLVLSSLSLSEEQLQVRDLGGYEASIDLPFSGGSESTDDAPREDEVAAAAADAARESGATRTATLLRSFDVRAEPDQFTVFVETDWQAQPFPERYELNEGRWPTAAGEVVVTAAIIERVPGLLAGDATTVPVLSGNESLTVVGVAEDRYGTSSATLLAAEGTWASFDWDTLDARVPTLSAIPTLMWSGASSQQVIEAVAQSFHLAGGTAAANTAAQSDAVVASLAQSIVDPVVLAQRASQGYLGTVPAAYSVPSVLLPPLAVAVAFAAAVQGLARNQRILMVVGVRRRDARTAAALATSTVTVVGAVIGVSIGTAATILSRPVVALLSTQPLSPIALPVSPALRIVVGTVLASLACSAYLVFRSQTALTGRQMPESAPTWLRRLRDLAVLVGSLALVVQLATVDSVASALAVAGTATVVAVLASSWVLDRAGRRLREGTRSQLAAARLKTDRVRAVTVVAFVTALVGPPVAVATVIDMVRTDEQQSLVSAVPLGQVRITTNNLAQAPPAEVVDLALSAAGPDAVPVQLSYLSSGASTVIADTENPRSVAVLDNVQDLELLNQASLDPQQRRVLEDGGVLVWDRDGSAAGMGQIVLTQQLPPAGADSRTFTLSTWRGDFNESWQTSLAGVVMLAETAAALDLEPTPSDVVLTELDPAQAEQARDAVLAAGWSRQFLRTYDVPDQVGVPAAVWIALIAVAVLLLVTVYALTRTQTSVMRKYAAGLMAIGVPPRWIRDSFLLQWTIIIGCGLLLGMLVAVITVASALANLPDLPLSVPFGQVAGLVLGTAGAGILGTLAASRRLNVNERDITIS